MLQFYQSVLSLVPLSQLPAVEDRLKSVHAAADRPAARVRAAQLESVVRGLNLPFVAAAVAQYVEPTLAFYDFPPAHWRHLRSNYTLDRIMRELRERTRVAGSFSDGSSAILLASARLRAIGPRWEGRQHLRMDGAGRPAAAAAREGLA